MTIATARKPDGTQQPAPGSAQPVKPRLSPPRVVVRGAWGRALPPPKPGQKEESIFTSWLMGLLGRPHPDTLDEPDPKQPAGR